MQSGHISEATLAMKCGAGFVLGGNLISGTKPNSSKSFSPVFRDVRGDLDEVRVVAGDPPGVVAHLAPGLRQVGPHARHVGGEGAHVRAHRGDQRVHAPEREGGHW